MDINSIKYGMRKSFILGDLHDKLGNSVLAQAACATTSAITYVATAAIGYLAAALTGSYIANVSFIIMIADPTKITLAIGLSVALIAMLYYGTRNVLGKEEKEAFRVLGVKPQFLIGSPEVQQASPEELRALKTEINKKYRRLALTNHPDKGGVEEVFKTMTHLKDRLIEKIEALLIEREDLADVVV